MGDRDFRAATRLRPPSPIALQDEFVDPGTVDWKVTLRSRDGTVNEPVAHYEQVMTARKEESLPLDADCRIMPRYAARGINRPQPPKRTFGLSATARHYYCESISYYAVIIALLVRFY